MIISVVLFFVVVRSRTFFLYTFFLTIAATTIRIKRVIVDLHHTAMPRKSAHSGAPTLRRNAITSPCCVSLWRPFMSGLSSSITHVRGVLPRLQGGA